MGKETLGHVGINEEQAKVIYSEVVIGKESASLSWVVAESQRAE